MGVKHNNKRIHAVINDDDDIYMITNSDKTEIYFEKDEYYRPDEFTYNKSSVSNNIGRNHNHITFSVTENMYISFDLNVVSNGKWSSSSLCFHTKIPTVQETTSIKKIWGSALNAWSIGLTNGSKSSSSIYIGATDFNDNNTSNTISRNKYYRYELIKESTSVTIICTDLDTEAVIHTYNFTYDSSYPYASIRSYEGQSIKIKNIIKREKKELFAPALDGTTPVTLDHNSSYSQADGVVTGKGICFTEGWNNERLWQLDMEVKHNNMRYEGLNFVGVAGNDPNNAPYVGTWEGSWMAAGSPAGTIFNAYPSNTSRYATSKSGTIDWFDVHVKKISATRLLIWSDSKNLSYELEWATLNNIKQVTTGTHHHNISNSYGPSQIRNVKVTDLGPITN